MPLANNLLTQDQLGEEEPTYPLEVAFCHFCSLIQITETVPPEVIFGASYPYYSSFSSTQLEHARSNAIELIHSRHLDNHSFVLEVGSNDGYLLKNYVEKGVPCLGIDPAQGPASAAQKAGIPTLTEFFDRTMAETLSREGTKADVIHLNNTFAHIADIESLLEGLHLILRNDGVIVIEIPYVRDLIDHLEFDTIYHEHLCYFSVTAVDYLLRKHGLFLNGLRRLRIHGGALRLYVEKDESPDGSVEKVLAEEKTLGISKINYYKQFARDVEELKRKLRGFLSREKSDGHSIIAYGAAAKGSTLLNFMDIGTETVKYCVDRNPNKQGMYMPGKHIPIHDPKKMLLDQPDYTLLLTWNFENEILKQQQIYRQRGGRFIIPVPDVRVV
jgi:SAM-dependent methyltransferase